LSLAFSCSKVSVWTCLDFPSCLELSNIPVHQLSV
jgi:hypothetical protein